MSDQKTGKDAEKASPKIASSAKNDGSETSEQEPAKISISPENELIASAPISPSQPRLGAAKARSMIEQIRYEADALSVEQRAHLNSHVIANTLHEANERCFSDVHVFRQMTISFHNLRANSKAFLSIAPDQQAIWSEGGVSSRMVGLSFTAVTQTTLYLRNFLINAREMYLETYQDCDQIELELYVRTKQLQLKGKVDLPPGASVTLESRCDRTSIIGLSSFAIDLE